MIRLFATNSGWAGLALRLGLGIVMFPHGMQKLFGWFGGQGLSATYHGMVSGMNIPAILVVLVIIVESFGSLGLIVGCLTRVAALGHLCNMIGAVLLVHLKNGFFMNWSGQSAGEGFEYHLLAIAIALALVIAGGGTASIDQFIAARWKIK
jgi:putative oxidoreductase